MKILYGILFISFFTCLTFSQEKDSTYLKKYENYLQQVIEKKKSIEQQLEILKESDSELNGAKSLLEALIAEEKKKFEGKKDEKDLIK